MKLKTKLLIGFLVVSVVPLAVVSHYTLDIVEKSFKQKEIGVLQSVGHDKATSVSSYFDKVQLQLRETAHTELVADAMEAFAAAFNGISDSDMFSSQENRVKDAAVRQKSVVDFYKNEFSKNLPEIDKKSVVLDSLLPKSDAGIRLQALYLSENPNPLGSKNDLRSAGDGSRYSDYHRKYHSYFNRLLEAHGFYDIFLVEPENGNIVYSVYKEIDYATSLINGPHANSGIGAAFQAAIKSTSHDKSHLIDYAAYLPSYNAPASFISHPILKEGNVVGVLIFQMPVDQINLTLENIFGLGETGKAYLVGETDGLLRSQLAGIDHNTILTETLNPDDLKHALGDGGHSTYIDYLGQQVEASIAPLDILGLNWLIVVEENTAEAFKELAVIKNAYLYAFALCLLFALGVATWLLRNTLRQLGAEPDMLNEIATEIAAGDLTRDFSQTKSPSGTLKTMVSMQQTLKDRDTSDKITMNRMGRLRDGLQKLSTPVALASSEHKITFTNLAMVETATEFATDLRTVVPSFDPANMLELPIAQFSDDPDKLHSILEALTGVHECEFKAGARIYNLVFNAIYNDKNERIGTSMEWQDRTAELRVMEEVDQVVSSANKGELSTRINVSDKQGVYLGLSNGINGLLEVNQKFVSDVSSFLGAISTGDLTQIINGQYEGSFADVKRDANKTVEQLEEVVFNIRSVAESVSTAAREINLGNVDLSQRTEQAAASLEETSTSMLEMTASVSSNADNSKEAKDLAVKAKNFAEEGGQVVGQAVTAMEEINESSRKMANIIGVIDDIAFQTNLLALNASVEAARAGEQGRGFAVVASEVRNLAGRSAIAAKEIKELIDDSVERVDRGTKLVNDSGQTLEQIVTEVKKVTDVVSEISSASQEQSDGISLVNNAIGQLDDATQQNAALVEEASAASESASSQAASLLTMIEFFSTSSSNSNQGKVKLTSVS